MTFAKFQQNRFRIDGEIAENHAILVNLTASIIISWSSASGCAWKNPWHSASASGFSLFLPMSIA